MVAIRCTEILPSERRPYQRQTAPNQTFGKRSGADQQAASRHFVATVGDLALRSVIVLIVVSEPGLATVTVIFAVTGIAFLMNEARLTVPPAFGFAVNPLP